MKKNILLLSFTLSSFFSVYAQDTTEKDSIQRLLKKAENLYASLATSHVKYIFYQKFSHSLDTIPYEIEVKHHTKTGKVFCVIHNLHFPATSPLYESQILLPQKNAKNLELLWTNEANKSLYGTALIRRTMFSRNYDHLPMVNPHELFGSVAKYAYKLTQTATHYTVYSKYYTLKINKQYEVEEIIYNNQKPDVENVYERIVITSQKHNLPALEDMSVYKIQLPERYNERFPPPPVLLKDTLAPAWECSDITSDKVHKLADLQGKVVVLDFWNMVCTPCIKFLPAMKELQAEFVGKDVVFIGMAFDKNKANIVKHLEKYAGGVFYTNVVCTEKEYKAFGVYGMPAFFVIDKAGKIIYSKEGTKGTQGELRKSIQKALDK